MTSTTKKPSIPIPRGMDEETKRTLAAIDEQHGSAVVIQNEKGGMTPVRVNVSAGRMEYWDGSAWKALG